jgi:hypothetical protein
MKKLSPVLWRVCAVGGLALGVLSCGVQKTPTSVSAPNARVAQTVSSLPSDTQQNHFSTSLETFNVFLDRS